MDDRFGPVFESLRPVIAEHLDRLAATVDEPGHLSADTTSPSPFPQHKGHPLFFGAVKTGKSYVSVHLMAIYLCPELNEGISDELRARMQGKSCFNFTRPPEPEILAELRDLAGRSVESWAGRGWL